MKIASLFNFNFKIPFPTVNPITESLSFTALYMSHKGLCPFISEPPYLYKHLLGTVLFDLDISFDDIEYKEVQPYFYMDNVLCDRIHLHKKDFLSVLSERYFLGGSRMIAGKFPLYDMNVSDSDYDFIAHREMKFLRHEFHEKVLSSEYSDGITHSIMESIRFDGISIIVKSSEKNYRKYVNLMESLSAQEYDEHYWKKSVKFPKDKEDVRLKFKETFDEDSED
jgi:hypothetical protein